MISRPIVHSTQMGLEGSAYCKIHRTTDHNMDDCFTLKQIIEKLIQKGELKSMSKKKEGVPNRQTTSRKNT